MPSRLQGFFSIACDELPALGLFIKHFETHPVRDAVVVAPDIGALRRARNFAEQLDLPLAIVEKRRSLDGAPDGDVQPDRRRGWQERDHRG